MEKSWGRFGRYWVPVLVCWCAAVLASGAIAAIGARDHADEGALELRVVGQPAPPIRAAEPAPPTIGPVVIDSSVSEPDGPTAPVAVPPSTVPPSTAPPSTAPPSTAPPSTAPPSTLPPSTAPPLSSPAVPGAGRVRFGFNEVADTPAFDPDDVARAVADIRPGSVVRFPVEWAEAQPTCAPRSDPWSCRAPGSYNWAPVDRALAAMQAKGLRALPMLISAPYWAWSPWETNTHSPPRMPPRRDSTGMAWWESFVRAFTEHVTRAFPGVLVGIEIWNEPSGPMFWTTSVGTDAARYRELLCHAYVGVKAAAPSLPVAFGGTAWGDAPPRSDGKHIFGRFIADAYNAGAGGCFDVLSIHPFVHRWDLAPDDPFNKYLGFIEEARGVAAAHGDAGRELWITEVGYPTQLQQPAWDLMLYDIAARQPDVGLFLFERLFDAAAADYPPVAVCAAPGVPKPVASALKQRFTGSTAPAVC